MGSQVIARLVSDDFMGTFVRIRELDFDFKTSQLHARRKVVGSLGTVGELELDERVVGQRIGLPEDLDFLDFTA